MAHSPEHNPTSPEAIELGYQPESVPARGLLIFLVVFIACGLAIHASLWWMMKWMEAGDMRFDTPRSVVQTSGNGPPPPNLQPSVGHDSTDRDDMVSLRREEDAMFSKMGWQVDGATHEIGIPSEIVRQVAEQARARAAAPFVPPTTTGKPTNSIVPGPPLPRAVNPGAEGGVRP